MSNENFASLTFDDTVAFFKDNVGAVVVADAKANTIRPLVKRDIFTDFISDSWGYTELIETLWYHFSNTSEKITEDYRVFLPTSGKFQGKYSRRINLMIDGVVHIIQVMVYPMAEDMYLFMMDELDKTMYNDEEHTFNKVSTIQNIYLFSMYIDIVKDTTTSIRVTELSDETINQQLKYSEWRKMIVNMISPEYRDRFIEQTDPAYLKEKYLPGQTSSFDCLMKNLEGKFIWVKLIFSRAETNNENDYRFVFMVQNNHENAMSLHQMLKDYELRASMDSLTSIYNHGRIETEINNAIVEHGKSGIGVSMMILDIDYFKHVNDKYGHSVGDVTLVHFTKAVQKSLEGVQAAVGRWGGEEFVAVCYDTSLEEVTALAEKIRTDIEKEPFDKIGNITCSIGVTCIREGDSLDTAFERMDHALYRAKSEGRNRVMTE